MQATEIIEKITDAGGRIWLEEDKVRARLPETLRPLVSAIRSHKAELMAELARRPAMPAGVRLIRWEPEDAPVQLSRCETATDIDGFIRSTLRQVEARLLGKNWLAGNWPLSILIDRLDAVGCHVQIDDPRKDLAMRPRLHCLTPAVVGRPGPSRPTPLLERAEQMRENR
jgi:hypothetical protein